MSEDKEDLLKIKPAVSKFKFKISKDNIYDNDFAINNIAKSLTDQKDKEAIEKFKKEYCGKNKDNV